MIMAAKKFLHKIWLSENKQGQQISAGFEGCGVMDELITWVDAPARYRSRKIPV